MSSSQAIFAQPKTRPTVIFPITTVSYTDTILNDDLPVPFYVSNNGVLEIRIQDNVQANLLTVGTFNGLNNTPEFNCKIMGGQKLVTSIGQTVKDFLTAYINNDEGQSPSNDFELIINPTMTKVQFSTNPGQFIDNDTYSLSDYLPSGSSYVTGEESNSYRTAWVFKSPMTIKYYSVQNSKYRYASFTTSMDS
jgi:hypothetical protein